MAGNITQNFGSSGQAFTITIASLGNNAARESTVVDNSSLFYQDYLILVKIKSAAASTTSTGYANIYAYATVDNGTTYSDNCTGSDAAVTLVVPPNLRLIGIINIVANSTTYKSAVMSVAAAFGGVMPAKFGIVIENKSGATFDATGGSHAALYQGVFTQYT